MFIFVPKNLQMNPVSVESLSHIGFDEGGVGTFFPIHEYGVLQGSCCVGNALPHEGEWNGVTAMIGGSHDHDLLRP